MKTKEYNHIVLGEAFSVIDSSSVELVKKLAGQVPPNGIRYVDGEDAVLLQSSSAHDILDCIRNQAWAHSSNPSRVRKGWTVYIVPSNPVQSLYMNGAIGVKFTAAADVYTDINNEFVWASEA